LGSPDVARDGLSTASLELTAQIRSKSNRSKPLEVEFELQKEIARHRVAVDVIACRRRPQRRAGHFALTVVAVALIGLATGPLGYPASPRVGTPLRVLR